jgi:hypothetical protein
VLDKDLVHVLKQMSINFAFIHLFYIEFEKIFQYLRIVDSKEEETPVEYVKSLKVTAWLLYILTRGKMNRLPSNANMLLTSLSYVLIHSSKKYDVEFSISDKGEKAVIPGSSKLNLQD